MDILQNVFFNITALNELIINNTILNITILNGIKFMISFIGLIIFCKNILNIKLELVPVFLISLIVCILNFAGLYGDLKFATYLIYYFGFIALIIVLIRSLIKRKFIKNLKNLLTNASFITLILFTIVLSIILYNIHLSHYDNFSHWALVVKELLCLDSMPNAMSADLMHFTSYPLGSSLFIYFGCRIIGMGEGIMLIMQGIFIISCMLPLFVFDKKFNITKIPVIILMYIILLIEPKIFNLLVDVLLACLGFASLMIILYYRKNVRAAFFVVLPTVIALVLVKNSGIFFAIIDVALLFYFAIKSGNFKRYFVYSILLGISVGATLWTWNIHCDLVFPEIVGKHSMTSSNFETVAAEKTIADVKTIALLMIDKLVNTKDVFIRTMITLNVVAFCARLWNKFVEQDEHKITKIALLLDLTFIIYFVGMFFMYVFSMPLDEALYLAGYERYIMTMVLYIVLIFTAYWVYISNIDLPSYKKANPYGWVMLYCFVLIVSWRFGNENYNILKLKKDYENSHPTNAVMVENFDDSDESYVMYVPEIYRDEYQTGYFNYLIKYKTRSTSCYPFLLDDFEKPHDKSVIKLIRDYDYFIIYDEDDYISNFAQVYLGKTEDVVGFYRIDSFISKE